MATSNSGPTRRSGIESLAPNHQQYVPTRTASAQQSSVKAPFPWNLTRFYDLDDSPWTPQGLISGISTNTQQGQHVAGSGGFPGATAAFQNYRSRPLPSDCDTTNEDSGYGGSGAPYSIEATSVYDDDQNPETQNAAQLIESFHLDVSPTSNAPQFPQWSHPRPTQSVVTAPASEDCKHYCSSCNTWLKTRSELNKHSLRHSKPFHCDALGCSRTEGFSTKNDLDRHKRSVHSDLSVSGPRYVCPLGQCGAKDQPKLWPRADNFRSHLRRIHQKDCTPDDDLEEYLHHQPHRREDLESIRETALSYMNTNQPSNVQQPVAHLFPQSFLGNQPTATNLKRRIPEFHEAIDSIIQNSTRVSSEKGEPCLSQDSDDDFLQPNTLHGTGQRPLHSSRSFDNHMAPVSAAHYHYTHANHAGVPGDIELSMSTDDESGALDNVMESAEHDDVPSNTCESDVTHPKGPRMVQLEPERSDIKMTDAEQDKSSSAPRVSSDIAPFNFPGAFKGPGLVEYLKTLPKELLKSVLDGDMDDIKAVSPPQDSAGQKSSNPCTECNKTFARPCELKKHMKRHEKPYGCTFFNCNKAFGSKNDWKRHESSQHWQLESWKCEDQKMNQAQPCDKVCHRRESFKNHLNKEHLMIDPKKIEEKLESCRIGRHCDDRFWCGFCSKVIEIRGEGVNAWTKRCDHIDNHFSGRDGNQKMNIIQWVYVENQDHNRENGGCESNTQPSSPDSDTSSTLKRKLSTEAEVASYKKPRQGVAVYMWTCVSGPVFPGSGFD
ncbi:hypothetical protein EDB80DRAFT_397528 [Ilyonectria destructans]|nr:hypothetical protein EDB80DRAFT_397528 [Ilyonectria destructans]